MRLDGKTALIVGGAGGIGAACCQKFADAGAAVVVADIVEDRGLALAERLAAGGAKAAFAPPAASRSAKAKPRSSTMSATTTAAPASANFWQQAAPIPPAPPTINAVFPSNRIFLTLSFAARLPSSRLLQL